MTSLEVAQFTVNMISYSWYMLLLSTMIIELAFFIKKEPGLPHVFMSCIIICIKNRCQRFQFMLHPLQLSLKPKDH